MNFVRKNIGLVVGGSIALVLVVIASTLLVRFRGGYVRVQRELDSNLNQLERLQQRDPFPSDENVVRVSESLSTLQNYLDDTLQVLTTGQLEGLDMERAQFPPAIELTARQLRAMAREADIEVPTDLVFGFQRYAAGNLPVQEHVPRLVTQLRTIEALVGVLFRAQIRELLDVEREVFDVEQTQVRTREEGMRRGMFEEDVVEPTTRVRPRGVEGLYTQERYTLRFVADDHAVRDVLNRLAVHPGLVVVRSLELRNEMARDGAGAARRLADRLERREVRRAEPTATERARREETERDAQPLLHEDRVVAGRERVHVIMMVDVYRFEQGEEEPE